MFGGVLDTISLGEGNIASDFRQVSLTCELVSRGKEKCPLMVYCSYVEARVSQKNKCCQFLRSVLLTFNCSCAVIVSTFSSPHFYI